MSLPPLDPHAIYKVLPRALWEACQPSGWLQGSADDLRDGYIHFSTAEQLAGTLARHYAQVPDLLLIAVDPAKLGPALRYEVSRGGAQFPHLYAPLPVAQGRVVARRPVAAGDWHVD